MSYNKLIITGNLGADPELRYTPQGTAVCSFNVAVSEKKRDKTGNFQDTTTWWKVTFWDKKAESAAKYLSKGSKVLVEGRPGVEDWVSREGKDRYTLTVTGTELQFLDPAGSREPNEYQAPEPVVPLAPHEAKAMESEW